jgi:hypothetical protein
MVRYARAFEQYQCGESAPPSTMNAIEIPEETTKHSISKKGKLRQIEEDMQ